jgi:hypothetical protein
MTMSDRKLYERCPDCNGMGSISVMDGRGQETEYQCERCVFDGGMVPVEPDYQYLLDWAVDVSGCNYRPDMQEVKEVFDRVVGEEKPVRSWAKKKGIPIDSLRNDDADLPEPTWREGVGETLCLVTWWDRGARYMDAHICGRPYNHDGRHTCQDHGCLGWRNPLKVIAVETILARALGVGEEKP